MIWLLIRFILIGGMILNHKAGIWGLNFLASVAVITIIFVSVFVLVSLMPGDISEVKASVNQVNTGSQLINFFRIPVRGLLIADLADKEKKTVGCSDLDTALNYFYGEKVAYKLTIDNKLKCSKGDFFDNLFRSEFYLPDYNGDVKKIVFEVCP